MQRFFGAARPEARKRSFVLQHAMKAASKYRRAIGVMYDLSGLGAKGEDCSMLIDDWKYLVDSLRVTNQEGEQTYVFIMASRWLPFGELVFQTVHMISVILVWSVSWIS